MKKFLAALGFILIGMAIGMAIGMETPGQGLIVPIIFDVVGGILVVITFFIPKKKR